MRFASRLLPLLLLSSCSATSSAGRAISSQASVPDVRGLARADAERQLDHWRLEWRGVDCGAPLGAVCGTWPQEGSVLSADLALVVYHQDAWGVEARRHRWNGGDRGYWWWNERPDGQGIAGAEAPAVARDMAARAPATRALPPAIEVPLSDRTQGGSRSTFRNLFFPHVVAGGRFSLARVSSRLGGLEPDRDEAEEGFLIVHGRDGRVAEVRRLGVAGGQGFKSISLPDGGAMIMGKRAMLEGSSVIARLSPAGDVLWSKAMTHVPDPDCDESREMCIFSEVGAMVADGERGWAIINFLPGVLRFDGGRTVEGDGFNSVLVSLDLGTGAVTGIAKTDALSDNGMVLRSGKIVMAHGSRSRLLVHDATSLELVRTLDVATRPGKPEALVAHADGFALVMLKNTTDSSTPAAVRSTLVGIDSRGKVRFTRDVPIDTQLASVGSRLYVATPATHEFRSDRGGTHTTNGVIVHELDASGRELPATMHPGYFDRLTLRLYEGSTGVWLTGTALEGRSMKLVAQPVESPVARGSTPPGKIIPIDRPVMDIFN